MRKQRRTWSVGCAALPADKGLVAHPAQRTLLSGPVVDGLGAGLDDALDRDVGGDGRADELVGHLD